MTWQTEHNEGNITISALIRLIHQDHQVTLKATRLTRRTECSSTPWVHCQWSRSSWVLHQPSYPVHSWSYQTHTENRMLIHTITTLTMSTLLTGAPPAKSSRSLLELPDSQGEQDVDPHHYYTDNVHAPHGCSTSQILQVTLGATRLTRRTGCWSTPLLHWQCPRSSRVLHQPNPPGHSWSYQTHKENRMLIHTITTLTISTLLTGAPPAKSSRSLLELPDSHWEQDVDPHHYYTDNVHAPHGCSTSQILQVTLGATRLTRRTECWSTPLLHWQCPRSSRVLHQPNPSGHSWSYQTHKENRMLIHTITTLTMSTLFNGCSTSQILQVTLGATRLTRRTGCWSTPLLHWQCLRSSRVLHQPNPPGHSWSYQTHKENRMLIHTIPTLTMSTLLTGAPPAKSSRSLLELPDSQGKQDVDPHHYYTDNVHAPHGCSTSQILQVTLGATRLTKRTWCWSIPWEHWQWPRSSRVLHQPNPPGHSWRHQTHKENRMLIHTITTLTMSTLLTGAPPAKSSRSLLELPDSQGEQDVDPHHYYTDNVHAPQRVLHQPNPPGHSWSYQTHKENRMLIHTITTLTMSTLLTGAPPAKSSRSLFELPDSQGEQDVDPHHYYTDNVHAPHGCSTSQILQVTLGATRLTRRTGCWSIPLLHWQCPRSSRVLHQPNPPGHSWSYQTHKENRMLIHTMSTLTMATLLTCAPTAKSSRSLLETPDSQGEQDVDPYHEYTGNGHAPHGCSTSQILQVTLGDTWLTLRTGCWSTPLLHWQCPRSSRVLHQPNPPGHSWSYQTHKENRMLIHTITTLTMSTLLTGAPPAKSSRSLLELPDSHWEQDVDPHHYYTDNVHAPHGCSTSQILQVTLGATRLTRRTECWSTPLIHWQCPRSSRVLHQPNPPGHSWSYQTHKENRMLIHTITTLTMSTLLNGCSTSQILQVTLGATRLTRRTGCWSTPLLHWQCLRSSRVLHQPNPPGHSWSYQTHKENRMLIHTITTLTMSTLLTDAPPAKSSRSLLELPDSQGEQDVDPHHYYTDNVHAPHGCSTSQILQVTLGATRLTRKTGCWSTPLLHWQCPRSSRVLHQPNPPGHSWSYQTHKENMMLIHTMRTLTMATLLTCAPPAKSSRSLLETPDSQGEQDVDPYHEYTGNGHAHHGCFTSQVLQVTLGDTRLTRRTGCWSIPWVHWQWPRSSRVLHQPNPPGHSWRHLTHTENRMLIHTITTLTMSTLLTGAPPAKSSRSLLELPDSQGEQDVDPHHYYTDNVHAPHGCSTSQILQVTLGATRLTRRTGCWSIPLLHWQCPRSSRVLHQPNPPGHSWSYQTHKENRMLIHTITTLTMSTLLTCAPPAKSSRSLLELLDSQGEQDVDPYHYYTDNVHAPHGCSNSQILQVTLGATRLTRRRGCWSTPLLHWQCPRSSRVLHQPNPPGHSWSYQTHKENRMLIHTITTLTMSTLLPGAPPAKSSRSLFELPASQGEQDVDPYHENTDNGHAPHVCSTSQILQVTLGATRLTRRTGCWSIPLLHWQCPRSSRVLHQPNPPGHSWSYQTHKENRMLIHTITTLTMSTLLTCAPPAKSSRSLLELLDSQGEQDVDPYHYYTDNVHAPHGCSNSQILQVTLGATRLTRRRGCWSTPLLHWQCPRSSRVLHQPNPPGHSWSYQTHKENRMLIHTITTLTMSTLLPGAPPAKSSRSLFELPASQGEQDVDPYHENTDNGHAPHVCSTSQILQVTLGDTRLTRRTGCWSIPWVHWQWPRSSRVLHQPSPPGHSWRHQTHKEKRMLIHTMSTLAMATLLTGAPPAKSSRSLLETPDSHWEQDVDPHHYYTDNVHAPHGCSTSQILQVTLGATTLTRRTGCWSTPLLHWQCPRSSRVLHQPNPPGHSWSYQTHKENRMLIHTMRTLAMATLLTCAPLAKSSRSLLELPDSQGEQDVDPYHYYTDNIHAPHGCSTSQILQVTLGATRLTRRRGCWSTPLLHWQCPRSSRVLHQPNPPDHSWSYQTHKENRMLIHTITTLTMSTLLTGAPPAKSSRSLLELPDSQGEEDVDPYHENTDNGHAPHVCSTSQILQVTLGDTRLTRRTGCWSIPWVHWQWPRSSRVLHQPSPPGHSWRHQTHKENRMLIHTMSTLAMATLLTGAPPAKSSRSLLETPDSHWEQDVDPHHYYTDNVHAPHGCSTSQILQVTLGATRLTRRTGCWSTPLLHWQCPRSSRVLHQPNPPGHSWSYQTHKENRMLIHTITTLTMSTLLTGAPPAKSSRSLLELPDSQGEQDVDPYHENTNNGHAHHGCSTS